MTTKDIKTQLDEANERILEQYKIAPVVKGQTKNHSWLEKKIAYIKFKLFLTRQIWK